MPCSSCLNDRTFRYLNVLFELVYFDVSFSPYPQSLNLFSCPEIEKSNNSHSINMGACDSKTDHKKPENEPNPEIT